MKTSYLLPLITLFIFSCTQKKDDITLSEIKIDLSHISESIKTTDLTDKIELIALETTDSSVFTSLKKIIELNNKLYISDGKSLYIYQRNGSLIGAITHQGEGPEEYIMITDFQIAKDGTAWILNGPKREILQFDQSGQFLKKSKLPAKTSRIFLSDDSVLNLYGGNQIADKDSAKVKTIKLDTNEILCESIKKDKAKSNYLHLLPANNYFISSEGGPLFFESFNDTIYKCDQSGIFKPVYLLNFGSHTIPTGFYNKDYSDIMQFFTQLASTDYAYGTMLFTHNKSGETWTSFAYKQQILFASVSDESSLIAPVLIENKYLGGYEIVMDDATIFEQSDSQIIIPVWPVDLLSFIDSKPSDVKKQLLHHIGDIREDDNPLLLFLKMNDQ